MKCKFLPQTMLKTALVMGALCAGTVANAQWAAVGTAGFVAAGNAWDHVFFDSTNVPYVSFSNTHGQVMKFNDTGWAYVGSSDITTGLANNSWSAMAPNGHIYFSYADGDNANKAAVLEYNGTSWASIGSSISAGAATYTNIVVASDGTPYLSYVDNSTSPTTLYVEKYDGTSWSTVGAAVTTTGADYPSLAIDKHDTLYIAYSDATASSNVSVQKFDGTNWVMMGSSFSAQPYGGAYFLSMAMDSNSVPYVAYMSPYPHGPSICVSKYDTATTSWVTVGSPSFTLVSSLFTSLAIDHSNKPYVSYQDSSGKISVMKYDGTSWSNLGAARFSLSGVVYTSIAIDRNNNPYTAYMDNSDGGTTVMKFPVCTPPTAALLAVSDSLICKGSVDTLSLTGTLNDATKWYWYRGSSHGALVDSGTHIVVAPGDTTTYYVHGFGGCVLSSTYTHITVDVDSVVKPTFANASGSLTSSAATGNQWYKNGTLVSGATSQTYTVPVSGWYQVQVTNTNGCSAMSDSVFVAAAGVSQVESGSGVHVFPSPFTNTLHIDFDANQQDLSNSIVRITDNMGRNVFDHKGLEQHNTLSLEYLPSGVYFIHLITTGTKSVLKVVKE